MVWAVVSALVAVVDAWLLVALMLVGLWFSAVLAEHADRAKPVAIARDMTGKAIRLVRAVTFLIEISLAAENAKILATNWR